VEARNSELSKEYETVIRKAEVLEEELQTVREEATHNNEDLQTKLQALSRENELLKHQLKRYVGVVQTMRRERGSSTSLSKETAEAVSAIPQLQPATEPLRFRADSICEAEHYEQKLVQVSEMHGELMEFNERLHMQLLRKELQIRRLRSQLAHYKGEPVHNRPVEQTGNQNDDRRHERNPSCPGLVNVWIPTAFLHGRGGDSHHVYQVLIAKSSFI
jgi:sorting nexin-29